MISDGIQERFLVFHQNNPHVYKALVAKAREAKNRGHEQYSIAAIYELVRWEMDIKTEQGSEQHRMSDNFKSRYARLIMEQEPDLSSFFNTRPLAVEKYAFAS